MTLDEAIEAVEKKGYSYRVEVALDDNGKLCYKIVILS